MTSASPASWRPWTVSADERPAGLEIVLRQCSFVLPWSQFLYAEGGEEAVRLAFSTHDIVIAGIRLDSLLADVATQRLCSLSESTRADNFMQQAGPRITTISVRKLE